MTDDHVERDPMESNGTLDGRNETEHEFARFLEAGMVRAPGDAEGKTLKAWVDLAETYRIIQVLRECRGNRSAAARVLGIGRRTLYAKMDKLGISAAWRMD
jgi:DNA-binding NtrC family response regulator